MTRLVGGTIALLLVATLVVNRGTAPSAGVLGAQAPPPGTPAAFLPAADAFGEGWSLSETGTPPADSAVFAASASAIYLGPNGARIILRVYQNLPGRAALQRSWEDVGRVWDDARWQIQLDYDYDREDDLAEIEFPSGTVDARRLDGRDAFRQPAAIGMYAIDPDIILLVVVSGTLGDRSGYEAADQIAMFSITAGTSRGGVTRASDESARQGSPSAASPTATPAAFPSASPSPSVPTSITVDMIDIAYDPEAFTIPANTDVEVTLTNSGVVLHDFTIEELGIDEVVDPGAETTITINAAAGEYEYVCTQPGHTEVGMVGTMTVVGQGAAAGTPAAITINGTVDAAIRDFESPGAIFSGTLFLTTMVVQFDSTTTADSGLVSLVELVLDNFDEDVDASGIRPASARQLGDATSAYAGEITVESEEAFDSFVVGMALVRQGEFVFVALGVALLGNPLGDALDVVERLVDRQPGGPATPVGRDGMRSGRLWDMLPTLQDMPEGFVFVEDRLPEWITTAVTASFNTVKHVVSRHPPAIRKSA